MTVRIILHEEAGRDLLRLGRQIARVNVETARRFRQMTAETIRRLADKRGLGSPCELENPAVADLRYWPVKKFPNHLVIFRELPNGVEIIRFVHAAQNWKGMFEAEDADEV